MTIQGEVTYRVANPKKLAALMDFTLAANGVTYASDDPDKLSARIINLLHVLARAELEKLPLRQAVRAADSIVSAVKARLAADPEIAALGLEILGLSILAIRPPHSPAPPDARPVSGAAR